MITVRPVHALGLKNASFRIWIHKDFLIHISYYFYVNELTSWLNLPTFSFIIQLLMK